MFEIQRFNEYSRVLRMKWESDYASEQKKKCQTCKCAPFLAIGFMILKNNLNWISSFSFTEMFQPIRSSDRVRGLFVFLIFWVCRSICYGKLFFPHRITFSPWIILLKNDAKFCSGITYSVIIVLISKSLKQANVFA